MKTKLLAYDGNNELDGIFKYLRDESGVANIVSSKIISLSGTSEDVDHEYEIAIGINNEYGKRYWRTKETDLQNCFYEIDFNRNRVTLGLITINNLEFDFYESYEIYGAIKDTYTYLGNYVVPYKRETRDNVTIKIPVHHDRMLKKVKLVGKGTRGVNRDYRFLVYRLELFGIFHYVNDLKKNINDLEVDLNNKINEVKKLKNKNKVLTDQLLEVNVSLNQAEKK